MAVVYRALRPPPRPACRASRCSGPSSPPVSAPTASSARSASPPGCSTRTSFRCSTPARSCRRRRPPVLWYAMPLVEGESLRDRLRRHGPQPLADVLRWTAELADALALRARARDRPPRHQARERAAQRAGSDRVRRMRSRRLRRRARARDQRRRPPHRDRPRARHPGLHEPGAVAGRRHRSTAAPTSTAWAACSTSCSPASRPTPAHRAGDRRQAADRPDPLGPPAARDGAARAWTTGRSSGCWPSLPPIGSRARPSWARLSRRCPRRSRRRHRPAPAPPHR